MNIPLTLLQPKQSLYIPGRLDLGGGTHGQLAIRATGYYTRAVKYSSTVQPKYVNMNCIHKHIHACIRTYVYSYVKIQTQVTRTTIHSSIHVKVKVKGKIQPRTGHETPEGSRGLALLFI